MPPTTLPSATQIRISIASLEEGKRILTHLAEERLVAGGTVIQASSLNWVGGKLSERERREVTAYTTIGKLPLIRGRLELLYDGEPPVLSQFVMTGEKDQVLSWIERNVRM